MRHLQPALTWFFRNAANLLATAALGAVAVGLWWERPSLALILPGVFVLVCLSWTHLRGGRPDA